MKGLNMSLRTILILVVSLIAVLVVLGMVNTGAENLTQTSNSSITGFL